MPALPLPKYGIDKLYLYPYYSTREAYERATGQSCPPFDKTRRPQRWCAPAAAGETEDYVIFDRVLAIDYRNGQPLSGADGKPYTRKLLLPARVAFSVNIAPNESTVEGADVPEYPCPLRALEPGEELFFDPNAPGTVAVKNTELYGMLENGFGAQDRALLRAIAKKLGV